MRKPIVCLDFDGVVHSYTSGWQGATRIPDPPTDGFFEWLEAAVERFTVVIFSARSHMPGGRHAMQAWLHDQWRAVRGDAPLPLVGFPEHKPPAAVTIDDRALTFTGRWDDYPSATLATFKPWNRT